jgi:hypothetical protein
MTWTSSFKFVALVALAFVANAAAVIPGCPTKLTKAEEDDYIGKIMGGVWAGNVFTIILFSVASAVICCGKLVEKKKLIGGLSIFMGIINFFVPLLSALSAGSSAAEDSCSSYKNSGDPCANKDCKDLVVGLFSGLGVLFAYAGGGYLSILFGILAISLGGAACCGCCKAKDPEPAQTQQVVVVQQPGVVQAVAAQPVVMAKA